jgi:hypothetical protein
MNSRAISDVIRSDLTTLEGIRTNTLKDIRLIEDYVYSLKSRFNEQQARIQTLEDRIRSNVDIELLRAKDKKNYWLKSSERVVDIKSNLSHLLVDQVVDADQDLDGPDSQASVAQETFGDDEEEGAPGSGTPKPSPNKGQGKPSTGGDGEEPGEDGDSSDQQVNLVGKKVRVTEGPDAGKTGTVKQVLPNGDIIIDVE